MKSIFTTATTALTPILECVATFRTGDLVRIGPVLFAVESETETSNDDGAIRIIIVKPRHGKAAGSVVYAL